MIEIVPYRFLWVTEFESLGAALRVALGETALAIHHIGSTAVPGLVAKDVIDIQMTVADLDAPIGKALGSLGYIARPEILRDHSPPGMDLPASELAKRFYGFPDRRVNLHVRRAGSFNQRYPLLCRDYLRTHSTAAEAYGEIKRQLARYFPENVDAYYDVKDPVFDVLMAGAEEWAIRVDWQIPVSDA